MAGNFRRRFLRSKQTLSMSEASNCTSSHDPRSGITRNEYSTVPLACSPVSKQIPGERCNWLTTTRSAPLMMKVPCSVMSGISPMYTSSSRASFGSLTRKVTYRGAVNESPSRRHSTGPILVSRISYFTKSSTHWPS